MCPPPSRIFHGRQIILDKMHQFFTEGSGKQLIYALYGLGGAGKTQTALKFIQDSSAHFTNIFPVDASKPETIDNALKNIAINKGFGHSAFDALNWLQSKQENWLLFFDNADDPEINLNSFIPQCAHGNIVITSRNPGIRVYGGHSLVSDMEEVDAISLLLQSADQESSEENYKIAAEIELCYLLPLAIVQAGAFIAESEDLSGYLVLYHKNRARLLSKQVLQSHDDYAWTVYTTWQISFDRLSKPAATLLQLCSFLHYTGISEDMFSNASKYDFREEKPSEEELQEPLEFLSHFLAPTGEWDSLRFLEVTNEIKAYSLISFDAESKMFSIHPLVHGWSRSTLVNEESCLACIRSMVPDMDKQQTSLKLVPHLSSLKVIEGINFQMEFWKIYYYGIRLQQARDIAERMVEKWTKLYGKDHPKTLVAMGNLAETYGELGEHERAEELKTTVLEKRTKLFGEDHPDTLLAMGNIARTYSTLGEHKQAEVLETIVLEKQTKLFGEDHSDTLLAMGNLAATYSTLGKHKVAVKLKAVVLEKLTRLFGGEHPDTLLAMGNLAATYGTLGEHKRAEKLMTVVLEKRTRLLGEDHPDTLLATVTGFACERAVPRNEL
ncbi:P-loop containing nucleoside triphosphate hydrolase protein [Mycena filopes]|nr:P-loop containing nucleoside triphosphate hydrolase protein [Mycena filopes]